jgi:hypothetical protein
MSRGNQRDTDRAKADVKKQQKLKQAAVRKVTWIYVKRTVTAIRTTTNVGPTQTLAIFRSTLLTLISCVAYF